MASTRKQLNKKPILLLDMDDTIADLSVYSIKFLNCFKKKDLPSTPEDVFTKLFGNHKMICDKSILSFQDLHNLWKGSYWFEGLPVIEGAREAIKTLNEAFDIKVVTAPYWGSPDSCECKYRWLKKKIFPT